MRKILVMEDEDNIRAFVVLNLKRVGYDVVDVASGEAALEAFAQADPEEVGEYIRSCGFFRTKAKDLVECAKQLLERFGGKVPGTAGCKSISCHGCLWKPG